MTKYETTREKLLHKVKPMGYQRPQTKKHQVWLEKTGIYDLDPKNSIVLIKNVLPDVEVDKYLQGAADVERESGKSGFGYKPRIERCYTLTKAPLRYSGVAHKTSCYPEHVSAMMKQIKTSVDEMLERNGMRSKYNVLADGIDIVYDDTFPRGGSVAAHKDLMDKYGRVDVVSFGQTRLMRVRRVSDKKIYNVEMPHNSVLVMYGDTFQEEYTHEVPKLREGEPVGARNSINVRYLKTE